MRELGQLRMFVLLLVVTLFCSVSASAQVEDKFYMQIDTTLHGVRVGQEFELAYIFTDTFDSISPPDFGMFLKIVKGPTPYRSSSTRFVNGEQVDQLENGFSYHVRFLSEGNVRLPESSVIRNGKAYDTPSLNIRVKPAKADIENVNCGISPQMPQLVEGKLWVKLTCNRRPDSLTPLLVMQGVAYLPEGHGSSLSNTKEEYHFTYKLPANENGIYTCTLENLAFGGVPYPDKEQEIVLDVAKPEEETALTGGNIVVIVLVVGLLIFVGVWVRFHEESKVDFVAFVLKNKRLGLSTNWAITHYSLPLSLLFIPLFFLALSFCDYCAGQKSGFLFSFFWCVLPLAFLSFVFYRRQRSKLNFQSVKTTLSKETLHEVLEKLTHENNWVVDYVADDCMCAHTKHRILSLTWGEQVFVVFDQGQVWLNSVNNLNKRSATFSFGNTKKNIRKVKEAIRQAELDKIEGSRTVSMEEE